MPLIQPMRPRDPHEPHRAATQLELFFDLVSVIAIAAVTAAFHHAVSEGHGTDMLGNFLFLFVAVWWAWMNHAWYASAFDNDDAICRLLTFVVMAGFLLFASGAAKIFETLDFAYGIAGWIVMRIGMAALWLRAARSGPEHRTTALRYAAGIVFAQFLWTLLWALTPPGSAIFITGGVLIFLVEFSVPVFAERSRATPWHRHHMIERYGLLNIIILGEILLSISFSLGHLYEHGFDAALLSHAIAALIVVFALWWLYFLTQEPLQSNELSKAILWGYGHIFIFLAGALLAAGFGAQNDVLTHHSHIEAATANGCANGAAALYLFGLWFTRDRSRSGGLIVLLAALIAAWMAWTGAGIWPLAILIAATLALRMALGRDDAA